MLRSLALILGVIMVPSCAEDEPRATAAEPLAKAGSAGIREAAAEPAAESSVPPPVPAVAPHLLYPRGVRITPNDYSIGPLQDLLIEAEPENAVTRTLVMFLRALAEGTIEAEAVAPDRVRSLRRSLQFHLTEATLPHAARVGEITVAEQQAHVAIRLFGDLGRVAGEIYLEAGAEGWRIVDVQLDLTRLALPYTPREQQFEPRSDRWLLLR